MAETQRTNPDQQLQKPMTTPPQPKPQGVQPKSEHQAHMVSLGKRVLTSLGEPSNLYRVLVRRLWDDHYRVNVVVGGDATSVKVAHSFFLTTDTSGNVVACNPPITKRYGLEPLTPLKPEGSGQA